jgi:ABC-type Mn2+/Zn2+ transport system ATPase subunit
MSLARFPYGGRSAATAAAELPTSQVLALDCRDVTVRYPRADRNAISGVSLEVQSGSRIALIGENGSGKSTLLKAIAGLLPLVSGIIQTHGASLALGRHRIAYLAQRSELDWRFPMTVRKLVLTGRYVHLGWLARPGAGDHAIVSRVLDQLQIADLADRPIGDLSGGQQQRALLARALAQEAQLLLLDEPMNAVDAQTRQIIRNLLRSLAAQGKTIIMATHDLHDIEFEFDQVVAISDGRRVVEEVARE